MCIYVVFVFECWCVLVVSLLLLCFLVVVSGLSCPVLTVVAVPLVSSC